MPMWRSRDFSAYGLEMTLGLSSNKGNKKGALRCALIFSWRGEI